nr:hypothetical protein [Burkholderia pyrrocinia]
MERDAAQAFRAIHDEPRWHARKNMPGRDSALKKHPVYHSSSPTSRASEHTMIVLSHFSHDAPASLGNHQQYAQAHGYRHEFVDASAMPQALPLRPLHRYESLLHVTACGRGSGNLSAPPSMTV